MKKYCISILITSFVLLFSQCVPVMDPDGMHFCQFVNNSDITIGVIMSGREYPDTLYPLGKGYGWEFAPHKKGDYIISHYLDYNKTRDEYLKEFPIVQVFVIDYDLCGKVAPDTIRKYNMVLRRYELTREWLEEHNWTVTYP
jgi:hypothetical protein